MKLFSSKVIILFCSLFTSYSLLAQAPTISSFSPDNGAVGTLVTITGTNLSSPTAFTIGGVAAVTVSNTGTQLVALVMPGAITGTVVVTNVSGSGTSASNFTVTATGYPSEQQGRRFFGTDAISGGIDYSVAVSKDGNTAIVGSSIDNAGVGAAWVFIRTNGVWSQQSLKLIGTGATGNSNQGNSVAISADGNTALVGGKQDNGGVGAVWVWTRTAGVWTQQGTKLVGQFASTWFGFSVALSADGNTAAISGVLSSELSGGGAWIFTRNNLGIWAPQGPKLFGNDNVGAFYGSSVALSADGNTLVLGNEGANSSQGGAWVFNRIGVNWTQEGLKIIGSSISSNARFGKSVAISADGNTIMVGAPDDASQGAAWVFTRALGNWSEQVKLVGTGNVGNAQQGISVALSADGNTGIVGGYVDDTNNGAIWVYTRSGNVWSQVGNKLKGRNVSNSNRQGQFISISGDGKTALVGGPNSLELSSSVTSLGAAWVFVTATSLATACYPSPHTYNTGTAITPLSPLNSGGPVPAAPAYTSVSTIAGTAGLGGSTDATGALARFGTFNYLGAMDAAGNLFIADADNKTIRKITPAGVVTTFAGTAGVLGHADGIGSLASFQNPNGIVIDALGNLFVIDQYAIRKITPLGVVTTFAGDPLNPGDVDATGVLARFSILRGIAIDATGNLFVTDFNKVKKITAAGVVTSLAGNGSAGYIDATGLTAQFSNLRGLTVDLAGNIYAISSGSSGDVIRKITPAGVVTTFAGNPASSGFENGIGLAAKFLFLQGITIDALGNLFVTDLPSIRKIDLISAEVTTLVGSLYSSGNVDGYLDEAKLANSRSITIDLLGNLYFEDNYTIRKINYTAFGYSISPNLPAGLVLNPSTGMISGTPSAVTPPTIYTLSTTNLAGTSTCNVTIETVTSGIVSGGGGGGLESKSLGDVIVKRVYTKAINNLNGPDDYQKMPLVEKRNMNRQTLGAGNPSAVSLSSMMPDISKIGYKAFNSTPIDILTFTNAKEVISTDFTSNQKCNAVAFATKTMGALYDHTKPICDRLKGASLVSVENMKIDGLDFVKYTMINEKGQREYATSFSIGTKAGRSDFSIQSTWLTKDYLSDETMFNYQLWAATPELVNAMVLDILEKAKAIAPIKAMSKTTIPETFVLSGKRNGVNLEMLLTNKTSNTNGYFAIEDKSNEGAIPSAIRKIPFTLSSNGESKVSIPMSDMYESTITMYVNNQIRDVVYMSDGTWTVDYNKATTRLSSFEVSNDPKRVYDADEYPLFRNVTVKANTSDYITIVKLIKGGGSEADLSAFKGLKFTAAGGSNLHITLVKNSIKNWNEQFSTDLILETGEQDYYIAFDKFVSAVSKDKINATDITSIVFTIEVGTGRNTTVSNSFSNVSFTKLDVNYINSLENKELTVYPNPLTGNQFTCSFYSPKAAALTLNITNANGQNILTKQVNAVIGFNQVPIQVNGNGKGVHIVSLEGTSVKYNSKKLIIVN
jgi:hypothetical protein